MTETATAMLAMTPHETTDFRARLKYANHRPLGREANRGPAVGISRSFGLAQAPDAAAALFPK